MIRHWTTCPIADQNALEWSMLPLGFINYPVPVTLETKQEMALVFQEFFQDPIFGALKVNSINSTLS